MLMKQNFKCLFCKRRKFILFKEKETLYAMNEVIHLDTVLNIEDIT